jgi:hypothetical protein
MATQLAEQPQVEEQTGQVAPETRDWEAEARSQGWTDKDEFKGPADKWIDAESFVKRGETINPFMKKQNDYLRRELEKVKGVVQRLSKAEKDAYDNAMADIRRQMREAAETGDTTAYDKAEKQFDKLNDKVGDKSARPDPRPAFNAFREANEWYDMGGMAGASPEERRARVKADQVADRLVSQGYADDHSPEEFFEKVLEEVQAAIPTLGTAAATPRAKPGSDVAGVTRPGAARNARTGANLPAEAKETADRLQRMGVYKQKTKADLYNEYAKTFDWDGWQKRNG